MNISSGMRATEGAVEDVEISEKGISLKVIGDQAPVGIVEAVFWLCLENC